MGQARKRGTYEERVAQAHVANATLRMELGENASPMLRRFMDKHGVQKFRMSIGKHFFHEEGSRSFTASNEDVNKQNEVRKQSLVDFIMAHEQQHKAPLQTNHSKVEESRSSGVKRRDHVANESGPNANVNLASASSNSFRR